MITCFGQLRSFLHTHCLPKITKVLKVCAPKRWLSHLLATLIDSLALPGDVGNQLSADVCKALKCIAQLLLPRRARCAS